MSLCFHNCWTQKYLHEVKTLFFFLKTSWLWSFCFLWWHWRLLKQPGKQWSSKKFEIAGWKWQFLCCFWRTSRGVWYPHSCPWHVSLIFSTEFYIRLKKLFSLQFPSLLRSPSPPTFCPFLSFLHFPSLLISLSPSPLPNVCKKAHRVLSLTLLKVSVLVGILVGSLIGSQKLGLSREKLCFQGYSGCWKHSETGTCGTEAPLSCWLLARFLSQLLEAAFRSLPLWPPSFAMEKLPCKNPPHMLSFSRCSLHLWGGENSAFRGLMWLFRPTIGISSLW